MLVAGFARHSFSGGGLLVAGCGTRYAVRGLRYAETYRLPITDYRLLVAGSSPLSALRSPLFCLRSSVFTSRLTPHAFTPLRLYAFTPSNYLPVLPVPVHPEAYNTVFIPGLRHEVQSSGCQWPACSEAIISPSGTFIAVKPSR